jgi:DNA polymerase-3 subunit alpha
MQTSAPKKKLTLQNFNGMLQKGMIPDKFDFEKKVYSFNKYLKTVAIGEWYNLSGEGSLDFYKLCDPDLVNLEIIHGVPCVSKKVWDKTYKNIMDSIRDWLKDNQSELLDSINYTLFKEEWEKYAIGTLSSWEMDSLCFYYHEHALLNVNKNKYGIINFSDLSEEPEIEKYYKRGKHQIPIYKLHRIIGTVINKNNTKSSVSLLTTTGVVTVKFAKEYYAMFNKQISEIDQDGKKKVKEKGWFTKGSMIMVTGIRQQDMFRAKTYANTAGHQLYRIVKVSDDGKDIELTHDRYGEE